MSVKTYRRKLDIENGRVDLSHGAGGRAMAQLIEDLFHAAFDNEWLRRGNDQAAFDVARGRMVMTTDGYVISPLFFPGGDIGSLAVHGTINDVAMGGAQPLYLSASFILEEGLPLADLKRIADSMGAAARAAGVPSSPATPKWSSAARAMACSFRPPGSASPRRVSTSRPRRRGRAIP